LDMNLIEDCFNASSRRLFSIFEKAYRLSRRNFRDVIHFYAPGMVRYATSFYQAGDPYRFPGISITGRTCQLNCEHCRGKMLENMIPAPTPEKLFKTCELVKKAGGVGCLITGGGIHDGSVPLKKFVPVMKRIKREIGLKLAVHVGLIDQSLAEELVDVGVDAAMVDILGADETVRKVYHLDRSVEDFSSTLSVLEKNCIPTVPHIVVGIHYGRLLGEGKAVEMLARHRPAAVVVVALMPLAGTPMGHAAPPSPMDIARVILASRLSMPRTPIILGCARPRGEQRIETDILALKAGVNGLAYPCEEAYRLAEKLKLSVEFHSECCSLLWRELV